jgi:hypothetical protein
MLLLYTLEYGTVLLIDGWALCWAAAGMLAGTSGKYRSSTAVAVVLYVSSCTGSTYGV